MGLEGIYVITDVVGLVARRPELIILLVGRMRFIDLNAQDAEKDAKALGCVPKCWMK